MVAQEQHMRSSRLANRRATDIPDDGDVSELYVSLDAFRKRSFLGLFSSIDDDMNHSLRCLARAPGRLGLGTEDPARSAHKSTSAG